MRLQQGGGVAAGCFQDLVVWQLADRLRTEVYRLTSNGQAKCDFAYSNDLRRAAASVASNIAEGFARYRPTEFHRFLQIARASLLETENHLLDGKARGHFSDADLADAKRTIKRATVALAHLMRYLRSRDATANTRPRNPPRP